MKTLAWLVVATAACAVKVSALQVAEFNPQGTVKGVRQVTARFSEPMVPLGDPRGGTSSPFEPSCGRPGTARWIDSRTWSFDFGQDLPAGVGCTFTIRAGARSLAGNPVEGQQVFAFNTGGPAVVRSSPFEGSAGIDEDQAFVLALDAEVTEASVLEHVYFAIPGLAEGIGVRLVTGEAREQILRTRPLAAQHTRLVVQARQRFPNDTRVDLVWGVGVATPSGVRTERSQVLPFKTRSAFKAQFHCEREHLGGDCIPVSPMQIQFSAPVARSVAEEVRVVGADGRSLQPDWGERQHAFVERVVFSGPFDEVGVYRVELPPDLMDDAKRRLINADKFPLSVKTGAFPPLAKFSSRFGIIEANAEPVLPVTVRNIEPTIRGRLLQVSGQRGGVPGWFDNIKGKVWRITPERQADLLPWLRRVAVARRETSVFEARTDDPIQSLALPKPNGSGAFEVIGIPLEQPGLYVVELESRRLGSSLLGRNESLYVPAAALVTNLSVHLKWGRENSLVWVTTLDAARPVDAAHVTVSDCAGTVIWEGDTDRSGIARINQLPPRDSVRRCPNGRFASYNGIHYGDFGQTPALRNLDEGLFVTAYKDRDLSFVHSEWAEGIEPWRFQLPAPNFRGPVAAHTVFDRTLLRAGETVHMKHVLRLKTLEGFAEVPAADRPTLVSIRHRGTDEKYEMPVEWNAAGNAENSWEIPREAKLGEYAVWLIRASGAVTPAPGARISVPDEWRHSWLAGEFRVEEFRVPLMKGVVQFPAEPVVGVPDVPVDLSVQYLAGGAAGLLPVTLRAQLAPKAMAAFPEFEGFVFANGTVTEGLVPRTAQEEAPEEGETAPAVKPAVHQRDELVLASGGTARTTIRHLPHSDVPRDLLAELEFRDPNGEIQTVSATVPVWPSRRLVGIKPDAWLSQETLKAQIAVVDVSGAPVAGAHVAVDLYERKIHSHRTRIVGGFYAYQHGEETRRIGDLCTGVTNEKGRFVCEGVASASGNVILRAVLMDEPGNPSVAHADVWVPGAKNWWFKVADSDRIDLLPEKRRYEPGETARLQVRMPFQAATALVTTEREGILDASVVELSGKEPVVEVPVGEGYAPNMFVSVLAVRGRVGDVQPTAMVDLGKPAFKLGIAEIEVGWRAHELKVTVAPERPVYRVRENAVVDVSVRAADGTLPPAGSEVAVAAVDEGLLELRPNGSWNLLGAMMGRRGYDVRTATAQMQVVGRRHYGLKALPHGGGGGRQTTRELFDTLLLWTARVPLDSAGEASVTIPLNDSLTSFRIVAVATGAQGSFGTGAASIRSTQDLMILSGVPPLVREGDRFAAQFTIRNAGDRPMRVVIGGRSSGLAEPFESLTVELEGGESRTTGWEVEVPVGIESMEYVVDAVEQSGDAADHLRVTQRVRPAVPVQTYQATLSQLRETLRQPVERPADALPGRGGIRVIAGRTLTRGLAGLRDWMRQYPYGCLEQRVSRAIALRDEGLWKDVSAVLASHLDGDGLLKYFPTMANGSDALSAYVLAVSAEAGWPLPLAVQAKIEQGLRDFVLGKILRGSPLPTTDLSIRKVAALEALARVGKCDPQWLTSFAIEPNLWPTSAVIDWWSILHRLWNIPDRFDQMNEAERIVRARLNLQGTTMGFSTEAADDLWWLMASPDTNAVRLILLLLESNQWSEDLPRLMQGTLARQERGIWSTTVANSWGVLAVEKFTRRFETVPVQGMTTARLAGASMDIAWERDGDEKALSFAWPAGREDLALEHAGSGNPWVTVQARAAIPLREPLSSGFRISRTMKPIEQRVSGRWSRGDLARVRLEIDAQSDMTWVVVNDPVPAGAAHLGSGLDRDSAIGAQGEDQAGWVYPAFEERAWEAFRAYYEFVPKGRFVVEHTVRLNQDGRFQLPPTRVEALYAPEMFGELPNELVEVHP